MFGFLGCARWDHPRRCGENSPRMIFTPVLMGSPPQVRGKRKKVQKYLHRLRITPAGAGKTQFLMLAPRRDQDHPRRCGENCFTEAQLTGASGSPPQVRGKPDKFGSATQYVRITPAGAGKTCLLCLFSCSVSGSPPQVRGKPSATCAGASRTGITPAGAGKTMAQRVNKHDERDHPRRCGENSFACRNDGFARGSPPQVRGKR